jgi:hypothetical protein
LWFKDTPLWLYSGMFYFSTNSTRSLVWCSLCEQSVHHICYPHRPKNMIKVEVHVRHMLTTVR